MNESHTIISIGDEAFLGCSSLTSVMLSVSVSDIGDYAFQDCSSLTSMTIPEGVTDIGWGAFRGCSSLTSMTIPEGVTYIGSGIFYGCSSLTSVTLPEGVMYIGSKAFYGCSSLTSVTIPESVSSIGSHAFYGCSSLTSVTIPEGVTSIDQCAFYECSSLTSATLPKSLTSIGEWGFYGCSSLISAMIPEGVTSIGYRAFYGCSSLTGVTLPKSLTSIGEEVFYGCISLISVTIPGGVTSFGRHAFSGCKSLTSVTILEGATSIADGIFYGCSSLTSVTIPEGVTSIDQCAFDGCSSLTSVTIPESVSFIWTYAFYGCHSLTSVTIPESVSFIGSSAFSCCESLTSVTILEGVTEINPGTFNHCESLTSVMLPESVKCISGDRGEPAFASYLANIYYSGSVSQWKEISIYDGAFTNTTVHCSDGVYVYKEETDTSSSTDNGSDANSNTNIVYPGTNVGGILVKPGLPCTVKDYTISLLSYDYSISYLQKITVNIKNNQNYARSGTSISFKCYKNSNTLLDNKTLHVEAMGVGESYESFFYLPEGTTIVVFGDDAVYSGKIPSQDVSGARVSLSQSYYTYDGTAKKPGVTVTLNGSSLRKGTDYTVKYKNNKNAGTASVVVTGTGSYKGTAKATFTIAKANSTIQLAPKTKIRTGKKISIGKATVTGSTGKITYQYYTNAACTKQIDASKVKKAGVYYVTTVAADSNYQGTTSKAVKLTILKAGKKATAYLKGTWGSGSQTMDSAGNSVSKRYAKFTKKYCKYYEKQNGKLVCVEKYKIVKIKKLKNKKGKLKGYEIRLQKGNNKHAYRLLFKDMDILQYFDSWKCSGMSYRGSSSLERES